MPAMGAQGSALQTAALLTAAVYCIYSAEIQLFIIECDRRCSARSKGAARVLVLTRACSAGAQKLLLFPVYLVIWQKTAQETH